MKEKDLKQKTDKAFNWFVALLLFYCWWKERRCASICYKTLKNFSFEFYLIPLDFPFTYIVYKLICNKFYIWKCNQHYNSITIIQIRKQCNSKLIIILFSNMSPGKTYLPDSVIEKCVWGWIVKVNILYTFRFYIKCKHYREQK